MPPNASIKRGEIWEVRFDPSEGDEIKKVRPAVVMTAQEAGRMQLQLVVPVTSWQPQFARYFWMIYLKPDERNGLAKESTADAFQIKSISVNRFQRRLGMIGAGELNEIAFAVALCVGYQPNLP
jgi:mRNA interferase MazF